MKGGKKERPEGKEKCDATSFSIPWMSIDLLTPKEDQERDLLESKKRRGFKTMRE